MWGTAGYSSADGERVCVGPIVRNTHECAIRWGTNFSFAYSTHKKDFMFGPIGRFVLLLLYVAYEKVFEFELS